MVGVQCRAGPFWIVPQPVPSQSRCLAAISAHQLMDSSCVGQSRARCGGNISLLPLDRLILTLNFPFHLLIIDRVVSRCPFPLVSAWFWHSASCCCPLQLLAVCSENSLLLAAFLLFVTIPKFVISIQKYFDILDIQSWLDFTDSQQSGL